MFDVILAPSDGSEHAMRAMAAAIDLATKYRSRLIVLHVELHHATVQEVEHILRGSDVPKQVREMMNRLHRVSAPIPVGGSGRHAAVSQELAEYIGQHVTSTALNTAQAAGVENATALVVTGTPSKRITETAKSEGSKLIVMGTRGLGGLESVLQGSVSQAVRHSCHCACLTIP